MNGIYFGLKRLLSEYIFEISKKLLALICQYSCIKTFFLKQLHLNSHNSFIRRWTRASVSDTHPLLPLLSAWDVGYLPRLLALSSGMQTDTMSGAFTFACTESGLLPALLLLHERTHLGQPVMTQPGSQRHREPQAAAKPSPCPAWKRPDGLAASQLNFIPMQINA